MKNLGRKARAFDARALRSNKKAARRIIQRQWSKREKSKKTIQAGALAKCYILPIHHGNIQKNK